MNDYIELILEGKDFVPDVDASGDPFSTIFCIGNISKLEGRLSFFWSLVLSTIRTLVVVILFLGFRSLLRLSKTSYFQKIIVDLY